jgi:hypothetical protein
LVLNLGIRRPLKWNFSIAEVTTFIIGADLLYYFDFSVNLRKQCFQDNVTGLEARGWIREVDYLPISTVNQDSEYHRLMAEFPSLTKSSQSRSAKQQGIYHHIQTTGPPVAQRFRRLTPEKPKLAKAEFTYLMEQRICPVADPDVDNGGGVAKLFGLIFFLVSRLAFTPGSTTRT